MYMITAQERQTRNESFYNEDVMVEAVNENVDGLDPLELMLFIESMIEAGEYDM